MQCVKGKHARAINAREIAAWAAEYGDVTLDLGTGDGRFVDRLARQDSTRAVIGVDTCRENLRTISRMAPENALFVVADALALPGELHGLATAVTVNFPWGSLFRGLLDGHPGLLSGLRAVARDGLSLEVRLNAGALDDAGGEADGGAKRVVEVLCGNGFAVRPPRELSPAQLRACPTTWAKRLAFGRDPRAIEISGFLAG